jgi:glycosyltransferase involved in cell wall biosynthesis
LKVCILTTSFPRFKGDTAGIFIYHFCRWLVKKGVNVEVIVPHDHGCPFTEKWGAIGIHRFPYFYPYQLQRLCYGSGIVKNIKTSLPVILQLPFLLISEFFYSLVFFQNSNPDIIHAHWTLPQGLVGILAKKILKIPCVTSIHGSDIFGLSSALFKAFNTIVIRNSDVCTANSKATAGIARKLGRNDNIKILPMGVDTDNFQKTHDIDSLKRKYKIKGPAILFVGRLIDWKGTAYLIEAMPEILLRFPTAKALIIGSGPLKENLLSLADSLALQEHVIFIGEVSHQELVPFYSMADIFVLPSIVNEKRETEGLGVVLLEAIACGLPVIGSDVGGIPDIIRNNETGLLCKQKDAQDLSTKIVRLLENRSLQEKFVNNGLQLVKQNFSWEVVADRFIEVYQNVCNRK